MARVFFTQALSRHLDCAPAEVEAGSVRQALDAVFAQNPRVRGYVLDEQGALRHHVVVFVDGEAVRDRDALSEPVAAGTEVYVMQALSGG